MLGLSIEQFYGFSEASSVMISSLGTIILILA